LVGHPEKYEVIEEKEGGGGAARVEIGESAKTEKSREKKGGELSLFVTIEQRRKKRMQSKTVHCQEKEETSQGK